MDNDIKWQYSTVTKLKTKYFNSAGRNISISIIIEASASWQCYPCFFLLSCITNKNEFNKNGPNHLGNALQTKENFFYSNHKNHN